MGSVPDIVPFLGDSSMTDLEVAGSFLESNSKILLVKFDANSQSERKILFQEHKTENPCSEKPLGKTLILSRIPPWCNPESIQRLFETACGPVRAVYLDSKPHPGPPPMLDKSQWPLADATGRFVRGYKFGHVVFEKAAHMRHALKHMDLSQPYVLSTSDHPVTTGVKKWRLEYNMKLMTNSQDFQALRTNIKDFVEEYDTKKESIKQLAMAEAEPDEEGWVTVSRHSAASNKKKAVGNASVRGQAQIKAREAKKRKRKELMNFYKFQKCEEKVDRLKELQKKFEFDKVKQLKMKQERQERNFKPGM